MKIIPYRMLQNYGAVRNHTCVTEKNYKLILNSIIRLTLKGKSAILDERGAVGLSPMLVQLNTWKSVKDMNLQLYDY